MPPRTPLAPLLYPALSPVLPTTLISSPPRFRLTPLTHTHTHTYTHTYIHQAIHEMLWVNKSLQYIKYEQGMGG